MYRFYPVAVLLIAFTTITAQTPVTDSLRNKLHNSSGKNRLQLLLALGKEQHSLNRDSAYNFAAEAIGLAANSDHHSKSLAALYFAQSYIPWGWVDSAFKVLEPALAVNPVDDPSKRELHFLLYRQKAMLYAISTKYKEALELLYQVIAEAEKYNDYVSLAGNLNSIGSVSIARAEPRDALGWFYKALSYSSHADSFAAVDAAIYINLANASLSIGRNDSALFYVKKALPLTEKMQNLFLQINALRIQTNALVQAKEFDKAFKSFNRMQELKAKVDVPNVTDDNLAVINFYISTSQVDKAITLCRQLLSYGKPNQGNETGAVYTNSVYLRLPLYEALAKCYSLSGNSDLYQQTLERIILVKDSVYAISSSKEIADIQTRYETQLKENSIIQQQRLDITRKNYLFYSLLILSVVAGGLGALVFREYRRRQKIKMDAALLEEKRLAEEAVKNAEEKERSRIAADLHDNLGAYAASMASNINFISVDESDETIKNAFGEIKNNSGAMIAELNDTIWVLKKESLLLTAISDRIKVFINRLRKSYPNMNIYVTEKIQQDHLLPSSQAFHLYRIMQEAINNALKHSHGNNIQVMITADENWKVAIEDDGIGIAALNSKSNGLDNMERRTRENGWAIEWLKSAKGGTVVEITPTSN